MVNIETRREIIIGRALMGFGDCFASPPMTLRRPVIARSGATKQSPWQIIRYRIYEMPQRAERNRPTTYRGSTMSHSLHTDEFQEAMVSLEMVCEQLTRVKDDLHAWKWVIVSLHNALQGYMVLALQRSNYLDIFNKGGQKKWAAYYSNNTGDYPTLYVEAFPNLYTKIQDATVMEKYVHSRPFKATGTQTASVEVLNELRNDFIHFFPGLRSLDVGGLPNVVRDCVDIIDFLTFESGNVISDVEGIGVRTGDLIKTIRIYLNALSEEYEK
jgi:hypothetical protein